MVASVVTGRFSLPGGSVHISVDYDPRGLMIFQEAARTLSGPKLRLIARRSLIAAGLKTRTAVRDALHQQMGTKRKAPIIANTRSYPEDDFTYVITGTGKGLPITDFPVRGKITRFADWRDQPRDPAGRFGPIPNKDAAGVIAKPWRITHAFKRSFVWARGADGGFAARLPEGGIRKLYGPSISKEIVKDQTAQTFEATALREIEYQLHRRLLSILP